MSIIITFPPSAVGANFIAATPTGLQGKRFAADLNHNRLVFEPLVAHSPSADGPLEDVLVGKLQVTTFRKEAAFAAPAGWNVPAVNLTRTSDGWVTDFEDDVDFYNKFANKAGDPGTVGDQIYYVAPNGSDAADGLSRDTPLLKLATAIAKPDVLEVRVFRNGAALRCVEGGGTPQKSVNVIVEDDVWFNKKPLDHVFVLTATPGVWQLTGSGGIFQYNTPYRPVANSKGLPVPWGPQVDTLAEVATTPRGWFLDQTANQRAIYIQYDGATAPILNQDITCSIADAWAGGDWIASAGANADINIYVQGATFPHQFRALSTSGGTLALRNCKFVGTHGVLGVSDAMSVNGVSAIFSHCNVGYCHKDFFTADNTGGSPAPWMIYHGCETSDFIGTLNALASNQGGTTVHLDIDCLDIGGKYLSTPNSTIAHVGTGKSVVVDCKPRSGASDPIYVYRVDGGRSMQLIDCGLSASTQGTISATSGSSITIDGDPTGFTRPAVDAGTFEFGE